VLLAVSALWATTCSGAGLDREARSSGSDEAAAPAGGDESSGEVAGPVAGPGYHSSGSGPRGVDDAASGEIDPAWELLNERWGISREALVSALSSAVYGVADDGRLVGPGGLRVDLARCPSSWDDRAGLDSDRITVAVTAARTGPDASFGAIVDGMAAYFDVVNAAGGIDGRSVDLIVVDDQYRAEVAIEAVDDLLTDREPFYLTTVGTPGSLALRERLNGACIPQPFVVSSHPAWGDPEGHPFTTGFDRAQTTEALLWGSWIEQHLAASAPLTIGLLAIDNDYGRVYADALETWAAANPELVTEVVVARHSPNGDAETLGSELAALVEPGGGGTFDDDAVANDATGGSAAGGEGEPASPEVMVAVSAGSGCAASVEALDASGLLAAAEAAFIVSDCLGARGASGAVPGGAGRAGTEWPDGLLAVGTSLVSTRDPALADDPFVLFVERALTAAGLDPGNELVAIGFAQYGWAHVELLRVASALPGGLSRSNLVLTLRSLDLDHPMLPDGATLATKGVEDPFPIEGGRVLMHQAKREAWVATGDLLDVNGSTPSCHWLYGACLP
jgi:hypothetical protein